MATSRDENAAAGKEPRVDLPAPHSDARGSIQPLVDDEIRSAQLIHSKAGTVRANHFHKTDYHYMYVLSGAFDYYYRPTGSEAEPQCLRVQAGQMVYTPPMVDHAEERAEALRRYAAGRGG